MTGDVSERVAEMRDSARMETGIPNLDRILGGGLGHGSTTMIIGAPGTGKTVFAVQVAFHAATRGAATLMLTSYSEPHDKLLAHTGGLSFFEPSAIGSHIQIVSLLDLLNQGAGETEEAILTMARRQRAALVIFDGFRNMRRFLSSDLETAHFLYSLGAKLALLGATTLVVVEGDPSDSTRYPELTVCDVIISLRRQQQGSRFRRLLDVFKLRGASTMEGVHPFTIDSDGITVYPRFESLVEPVETAWRDERAHFGVPAVDALTGGGLTSGTVTVVAGSTGVGKTLLGLHFAAEGARVNEPTLFVGFMEDAVQLRAKGRIFGLDLVAAEASGNLRLLALPGYDLEADRIVDQIRRDIEQRGVRRLVIDSASELQRGINEAERQPGFLSAMVSYLRGRGVTTYVTYDIDTIVGPTLAFTGMPLSVLAENLLVLRFAEYRGELHRLLTVLKMRFSAYDKRLHEYTITAGQGIQLLGTAPPGVGLLTGVPQPLAAEPVASKSES